MEEKENCTKLLQILSAIIFIRLNIFKVYGLPNLFVFNVFPAKITVLLHISYLQHDFHFSGLTDKRQSKKSEVLNNYKPL